MDGQIQETDMVVLDASRPVHFADHVPTRLRRREDLVDIVANLIGLILVGLLSAYAQATTQAVTQDVRNIEVIREILLPPLTTIEGLALAAAPLLIVASMVRRRRFNELLQALTTAIITAIVIVGFKTAFTALVTAFPATPHIGLHIHLALVTLVAFFTAAGESNSVRSVRWAWGGLWFVVIMWVLRSSTTLPSAFASVFVGRVFGCSARWLLGFKDRRATGTDLVEGLESIGITPSRILRSHKESGATPLDTWLIYRTSEQALLQVKEDLALTDPVPHYCPADGNRHYDVWDSRGTQYLLTVCDPGQELTTTLVETWRNLRLRGISRWVAPSAKANVERSTLTMMTARRAQVRVPESVGVAQAGASLLLLEKALPPSSSLSDLESEAITDDLLDDIWTQLVRAHQHALAHRDLTFESIRIDTNNHAWLVNWFRSDFATSSLNRRVDTAQMLTLLAARVGAERAIASARRAYTSDYLRSCAPLIQRAVIPFSTTSAVRRSDSDLLGELRGFLAGSEESDEMVTSVDIHRFSLRTIVTVVLLAFATITILGSLNFSEIAQAVASARLAWIGIAIFAASLTWVGASMALIGFSPQKLRFRDAFLVQIAASLVTVVAPAGMGPAALNLRYLTKQKIATAVAVTTVTIQQITQLLAMIGVLIVITVATGQSVAVDLPYSKILFVLFILLVVASAALSIPRVRHYVWSRIEPLWQQVWPRMLWVLGQPSHLALIFFGNLIMNIGFIGAFWASLVALGGSLDLLTLTVTYLASNSLGSVIPSPGGIGPVEATLTAGLQVAGVALSIALPTAILYRLVTFYGRAPVGWVALKYLQKKNIL